MTCALTEECPLESHSTLQLYKRQTKQKVSTVIHDNASISVVLNKARTSKGPTAFWFINPSKLFNTFWSNVERFCWKLIGFPFSLKNIIFQEHSHSLLTFHHQCITNLDQAKIRLLNLRLTGGLLKFEFRFSNYPIVVTFLRNQFQSLTINFSWTHHKSKSLILFIRLNSHI